MKRSLSLVIITVVIVTGCVSGPSQTSTPAEINPIEPHNTVSFSGNINISNESFTMQGEVRGCFGQVGPEECRDTRVLLYTADGSLIAAEYLGTLNGRRNVSLTTDRIPHYVILTSPDIWEANHTTVQYLFYDEGTYLGKPIDEREELPVEVRTETPTDNTRT